MTCEDCGGGLLGGPHEPWCMQHTGPIIDLEELHRTGSTRIKGFRSNLYDQPRRPKPIPGARCFTCRERVQDCVCPEGPDPD